ncbi:hypothetical protein EJ08DRAFT_478387 [Tothia fuscella]|uniref:Serine protease n=1 Tax=Tothia fuscella TaxID=1048955 RepID=A0A9P4TUG2_9PEZI|nr:hypothetical protein EJ08DRAFT_478387 [Tothia fuscella]
MLQVQNKRHLIRQHTIAYIAQLEHDERITSQIRQVGAFAKSITVKIITLEGGLQKCATAFVVSGGSSSILLTNRHAVEKADGRQGHIIRDHDNVTSSIHAFRTLSICTDDDLALIWSPMLTIMERQLPWFNKPVCCIKPQEPLLGFGYPGGVPSLLKANIHSIRFEDLSVSHLLHASLQNIMVRMSHHHPILFKDILTGTSGSSMFTLDGVVIGVQFAGSLGTEWLRLVPAWRVVRFLRSCGLADPAVAGSSVWRRMVVWCCKMR